MPVFDRRAFLRTSAALGFGSLALSEVKALAAPAANASTICLISAADSSSGTSGNCAVFTADGARGRLPAVRVLVWPPACTSWMPGRSCFTVI